MKVSSIVIHQQKGWATSSANIKYDPSLDSKYTNPISNIQKMDGQTEERMDLRTETYG